MGIWDECILQYQGIEFIDIHKIYSDDYVVLIF